MESNVVNRLLGVIYSKFYLNFERHALIGRCLGLLVIMESNVVNRLLGVIYPKFCLRQG